MSKRKRKGGFNFNTFNIIVKGPKGPKPVPEHLLKQQNEYWQSAANRAKENPPTAPRKL